MRHCPLCNNADIHPFQDTGRFKINACDECGVRFLDPQPTAEELESLYSSTYFSSDNAGAKGYKDYNLEADRHRRTFQRRLPLIPRVANRHKLLDVGAATGYFVEQARLSGWDAIGIEPSQWASDHARTVLRQPVQTGMLTDSTFPPCYFDAVTLWEVIEHLPDPRATLWAVHRTLKPGGYLAMSTPDAGSRVARVFGKRWLGWRKIPEHLFFFDLNSLRHLLRLTGFEIVRSQYVSISVGADFAWSRAADLTGLQLPKLPERVARLTVDVNPLYDLFVLARRLDGKDE